MLRSVISIAGLMVATPGVAGKEETLCQTAGLVVMGETSEVRDRICQIAAREVPKLAMCNVAVSERVKTREELAGARHARASCHRPASPARDRSGRAMTASDWPGSGGCRAVRPRWSRYPGSLACRYHAGRRRRHVFDVVEQGDVVGTLSMKALFKALVPRRQQNSTLK